MVVAQGLEEVTSDGSPGPPVGPVLAAVVALAAAAFLFVLGQQLWAHAVGYILSTLVLIGFVARYRWAVVRLRANRSYAHSRRWTG